MQCYLNVASAADEKAVRTKLMLDILGLAERSGVAIGDMDLPAARESQALAPPAPARRSAGAIAEAG